MNALAKIKRKRILKEILRGSIIIIVFLVIFYIMLNIITWK